VEPQSTPVVTRVPHACISVRGEPAVQVPPLQMLSVHVRLWVPPVAQVLAYMHVPQPPQVVPHPVPFVTRLHARLSIRGRAMHAPDVHKRSVQVRVSVPL
jgi:hypothetical protein